MKHQLIEGKEGALERDEYKFGEIVSADQFVVGLPGRLLELYGRDSKNY